MAHLTALLASIFPEPLCWKTCFTSNFLSPFPIFPFIWMHVSLPGLCTCSKKAHRRGLNSLPVTTDRKSWNGMLCLSALRAAQRETIIISSALMLPPAKIHCRCSTFVTGAELPEEQMTKTRRQAGRNAEGSQTDSFWIESERQAGRFPTRRPDKFRQRYKQWCRHTDRHADNLQMYGQSYNDV